MQGRVGIQHDHPILWNDDTWNGKSDSFRGKSLESSLVDLIQKLSARFRSRKSEDEFVCNADFEENKVRWDLRSIQMDENFNHRKGSVCGRIERGNSFPVPPASGSTRPIASPFGVLLAAEPK